MAVLEILHYPDERLRQEAKPVPEVDGELRQLIDDMLETMYAARGVGLAAPQVDRHLRLLVMDVSEDQSEPLALVNPEIIAASGEQIMLRRDLELVERTGARYHVQHVSSAGSVKLIREAKQAGLSDSDAQPTL